MAADYLPAGSVPDYLRSSEIPGVEQWLSFRETDGFRFIHWIRIIPEQELGACKWCLYEKNSLDVGNEAYIDMDEFEDVGDPDEPEGKRLVFDFVESALAHAEKLGAKSDRYVAAGGIQHIYRRFYLEHGPPAKGAKEWFSG